MNLYRYCGNAPTDLDGPFWFAVPGKTSAARSTSSAGAANPAKHRLARSNRPKLDRKLRRVYLPPKPSYHVDVTQVLHGDADMKFWAVKGTQFWQTNEVHTVTVLQDPNNQLRVWTPEVEYRLDVNPIRAGRTTEVKAIDHVRTAVIQGPQTEKGRHTKKGLNLRSCLPLRRWLRI